MAPCLPVVGATLRGTFARALFARVLAAAFLAAALLCAPSRAAAQIQQLHQQCANVSAAAAERIAACSQLVRAGWDTGRNLAVSYFNRGIARNRNGEFDLALADFTDAIRTEPTYVPAVSARGAAHMWQCSFDAALSDFDRAIALNPNFPPAHNNRAAVFLAKGDPNRAIAEATVAISLDASYGFAYATRAASHIKLRHLDAAAADADRAVVLKPGIPVGYNVRGLLRAARGEIDLAISDFDRAVELDPRFAPAYANRAFAFKRKGDLDRALADYARAIELRPRCPGGYEGRASVYLLQGNPQRALADANTAITLNARSAAAFATRGSIYLKMDRPALALDDLTQAIRLDATLTAAHTYRGLAYERLGHPDDARAGFMAALALPLAPAADAWAHDTARKHLDDLAHAQAPAPRPATSSALVRRDAPAPGAANAGLVAAVEQKATPPAASSARPLAEALAACEKRAAPGPLTLPGPSGDVVLNQCYRGPDYMTCAVAAIAAEARAIEQSYKDIVAPNYSAVSSVDAVCRMDAGVIADHLKRSKSFDIRWRAMEAEYNKLADCSNSVEESIRHVILPDMPHGGDLVKSMIQHIRDSVATLSATQREVAALSHQVGDSRKVLATLPVIRASMCAASK